MNIPKIVTTISTELANTTAKAVSNPIKTAPIIDGLTGLDALACQNMPAIKKYFPYEVEDSVLQKVKNRLSRLLNHEQEMFDDKTIKYVTSYFIDTKSPNEVSRQAQHSFIAFDKFAKLDDKTKEKFFSSEAIKILMDSIDTKAFRFSCFDLTSDEIDELEKLIGDDFLKHYFKTYLIERSTGFQTTAKDILPEFIKRAKNLRYGFCCTKEAPKFYDLLKDRSCDDIDELANILFANTRFLDEKEFNEIHAIFKRLLSAKTPDGKFIFGTSKISDTTSKNMLSGIENILNAKKNNPETYEQYLKLLDLTEQGKIPPSVLGTLAKEGKISDEFIEIVNKLIGGKCQVEKFADFNIAKAHSKLGDTLQIGDKLFYRNKDELTELNLSKDAFEKLFPEVETMALGQGQLGDCYLISAIFDFMKNPNAKGKIYQMFSQDGDDIIVTIPDAKEFPIRFTKAALEKGKENVNASLGIQMLESAYSQTRALKYGTANKITAIEGGNQLTVYNALLGKNTANLYTTYDCTATTADTEKAIEEIEKAIKEAKSKVKGLKDSDALFAHLKYEQEQELLKNIADLEATQRMLQEDKAGISNLYENISPDELLQKLLKTPLSENLVSIGSKCKSGFFDKDKLVHGTHAYSVLGINKDNRTIDIVNPWNTATHSTITFEQFKYWFDALNIASLS